VLRDLLPRCFGAVGHRLLKSVRDRLREVLRNVVHASPRSCCAVFVQMLALLLRALQQC